VSEGGSRPGGTNLGAGRVMEMAAQAAQHSTLFACQPCSMLPLLYALQTSWRSGLCRSCMRHCRRRRMRSAGCEGVTCCGRSWAAALARLW